MAASFRIEKDSLGELKVPADAYYGVQTARAVANFPVSGLRAHPTLILAYVHIKRAAAVVNGELGMLDKRRRDAIVKTCDWILAEAKQARRPVTEHPDGYAREGTILAQWVLDAYQAGAGTSFNMNSNEVIANLAGEKFGKTPEEKKRGSYALVGPNDHVNMAQSTNDTMPTAIRLSNLILLPELMASIDLMIDELATKGKQFKGVITTGRTHLQDATPITLGQVFNAQADCLRKAKARIEAAAKKLSVIGLGGTAVGTGMNANPQYAPKVAAQLGKQLKLNITSAKNLVEMHNSMADQLEFSGSLRELSADLTRISNDLRLLSSGPTSGIGEINLPPVQPGSSIMPGKVNPVMLEMFNMLNYQVLGLDQAILACSYSGQYQLNVMMPMIAWDLLHMQMILANSLRLVAERCVRGITANEAQCRSYFEASMGLATALNPIIGYMNAAEIVKRAVKQGTPIMDELKAAKTADGSPVLTEAQMKAAFKPERLTKPGSLKLDAPKKGKK